MLRMSGIGVVEGCSGVLLLDFEAWKTRRAMTSPYVRTMNKWKCGGVE